MPSPEIDRLARFYSPLVMGFIIEQEGHICALGETVEGVTLGGDENVWQITLNIRRADGGIRHYIYPHIETVQLCDRYGRTATPH